MCLGSERESKQKQNTKTKLLIFFDIVSILLFKSPKLVFNSCTCPSRFLFFSSRFLFVVVNCSNRSLFAAVNLFNFSVAFIPQNYLLMFTSYKGTFLLALRIKIFLPISTFGDFLWVFS